MLSRYITKSMARHFSTAAKANVSHFSKINFYELTNIDFDV